MTAAGKKSDVGPRTAPDAYVDLDNHLLVVERDALDGVIQQIFMAGFTLQQRMRSNSPTEGAASVDDAIGFLDVALNDLRFACFPLPFASVREPGT